MSIQKYLINYYKLTYSLKGTISIKQIKIKSILIDSIFTSECCSNLNYQSRFKKKKTIKWQGFHYFKLILWPCTFRA